MRRERGIRDLEAVARQQVEPAFRRRREVGRVLERLLSLVVGLERVVEGRRPSGAGLDVHGTHRIAHAHQRPVNGTGTDVGDQHPAPKRADLVAGDVDPLVDELLARGHTHAFADYWIAYKLSFESDERLIGTGAQHTRGMDDRLEVEADPRPAYVTFAGDPAAARIEANLAAAGVDAEHLVVGAWEAYLPQEDVPNELRTWIYQP